MSREVKGRVYELIISLMGNGFSMMMVVEEGIIYFHRIM